MLALDEIPVPAPKAGEYLVRIGGAGVNPVDYKIRQGGYPKITQAQLAPSPWAGMFADHPVVRERGR